MVLPGVPARVATRAVRGWGMSPLIDQVLCAVGAWKAQSPANTAAADVYLSPAGWSQSYREIRSIHAGWTGGGWVAPVSFLGCSWYFCRDIDGWGWVQFADGSVVHLSVTP